MGEKSRNIEDAWKKYSELVEIAKIDTNKQGKQSDIHPISTGLLDFCPSKSSSDLLVILIFVVFCPFVKCKEFYVKI